VKDTNHQQPLIKSEAARTIVGVSTKTSLVDNKTMELWQTFGPLRKQIENLKNEGSYSIQIYASDFMTTPFSPATVYTKWAGVEVTQIDDIPIGLESMTISEGKWAVFVYKGTTSDFGAFAQYIYKTWLPSSGYTLDDRPHFEYMSENYLGPNNPEAEEEVWIPIK